MHSQAFEKRAQNNGGDARIEYALLAYDFARPFEVPHRVRMTQADYFRPNLQINTFGIFDVGRNASYLCFWPEPMHHGTDEVISLLHRHLTEHADVGNAQILRLQADNAASQNKSRAVVAYAAVSCSKANYKMQKILNFNFIVVARGAKVPRRH